LWEQPSSRTDFSAETRVHLPQQELLAFRNSCRSRRRLARNVWPTARSFTGTALMKAAQVRLLWLNAQ
jgi:hypothetical protein